MALSGRHRPLGAQVDRLLGEVTDRPGGDVRKPALFSPDSRQSTVAFDDSDQPSPIDGGLIGVSGASADDLPVASGKRLG
jgi:hypothetical protein